MNTIYSVVTHGLTQHVDNYAGSICYSALDKP